MAGRVLVDDELCHRGVVGERVCVPPERRVVSGASPGGGHRLDRGHSRHLHGREAQLTSRSSPVFTS